MNKVYLVSYSPGPDFKPTDFHNFIDSLFKSGKISDWWHYIDSVYLIAATAQVNEIYNSIFPGVPGRNLLIVEINPKNAQGWLPKDAWTWIKKYQV